VHNIKQETELHLITSDQPGILGRILGTLANARVNLKALCSYNINNEKIFKLLTSDNKMAEKSLKALGYKVKANSVVTVLIDDRIGAGAEIGVLLANAVIKVKYCYGSSIGTGKTLLVFKTSNNKKAIETLS